MLAITADRDGNISAYQDGILRGRTTFTAGGDPNAPFIGDLSTPHPWVLMQHGAVEDPQVGPYDKDFAGDLDDVLIYDQVLTDAQIEDIFLNGFQTAPATQKTPIVYLDFEGNALDKSGNELNGTVVGTVNFETDNARTGQVANFAEDGYIKLPIDSKLDFGTDKDFTFSVWVNSTTTVNSDPAIISSQDWNSGSNPGFGIYLQDDDDKGGGVREYWKFKCSGGTLDFDGHDIITNGWGEGFETAVDGQWTMLTITADRDGNVSAYQDGILRGQTTFTAGGDPSAPFIGDLSTPHPWVIMQHGAVEDPQVGPYDKDFAGKLDDILIYDQVLTEEEVADLFANGYENTNSGDETLIVDMPFKDNFNDLSGNVLNGTVVGTVNLVFDESLNRQVAEFAEDGYIKLPIDSKLDFGTDKDFTFSVLG